MPSFELVGELRADGVRVELGDGVVLGRDVDGPGRLDDPLVSRRHARVISDGAGALLLEDLGSATGTFLNDGRIVAPTRLRAGDVVRLGTTSLRVKTANGAPRFAEAALLRDGVRHPIGPHGLAVGRDPANDVVLATPEASRRHARIRRASGCWYVDDLGTLNGTLVNGERLRDTSRALRSGDRIAIAGTTLRFLEPEPDELPLAAGALRLGREPGNDVVLDDPAVSRRHAELVRRGDVLEVVDLGSRNGTLLDGRPIQRASLAAGSEIGIGPFRLLWTGTGLVRRDDRGALHVDAAGLVVEAGGRRILDDVSVSIRPGELIAVLGASGSGKSTLMRALAGVSSPKSGAVSVNGDPVGVRLTDIGYVPQHEIVHGELTVDEALRYSARLRLPPDAGAADIEAAVARVIAELGLSEHAGTRIGRLSGGQRKRAGMAAELLTQPSILLLDEPTTGLDPALEARMMALFRGLAQVGTRSVTVVTHSTQSLELADRVCVMSDGALVFAGTPLEAKAFFGVEAYDEIYAALARRPAAEWRAAFEAEAVARRAADGATAAQRTAGGEQRKRPRPNRLRQARVLIGRTFRLLTRDRRNLAILLGQVPVIALAIGYLFEGDVLGGGPGRAGDAVQLMFLLATTAVWLGSIDGSRELIKEAALAGRERAVGVALTSYIASKVVVLGGLVSVQVTLLLGTVALVQPLPGDPATLAALWVVLFATGAAALGLGLVVSAVVTSEDQAASLIPLVLIPQLLFAGAVVAVERMSEPVAALSALVFARWSLAGLGTAIDMDGRLAADPAAATTSPYGEFFSTDPPVAVAILAVFAVALVLTAAVRVARR